jgi:hypothetical protein
METTREFVGQRAHHDQTGWRVGQLSWVGRVAALCAGMVGMVTAVASPTAAAQTPVRQTAPGGRSTPRMSVCPRRP